MKGVVPLAALAAIALVGFSGCSATSDFTAISGKNVNLSSLRIDRKKSKGHATGKDCQHIIVIFPTSGPPSLDEALDRALEAKQANLLVDAIVDYHFFYIPYIYGQTCWAIEGDAYDTYE